MLSVTVIVHSRLAADVHDLDDACTVYITLQSAIMIC